MTEEFNLSEKRKEIVNYYSESKRVIDEDTKRIYFIKDIIKEILNIVKKQDKEFIRLLKEILDRDCHIEEDGLRSIDCRLMEIKIDKLAGEKLK
jgi:hypothetical protein